MANPETAARPPKQSNLAKDADKTRKHIISVDQWDEVEGQEFGGKSDILDLHEGEVAGPFSYSGHQEMVTDLGATTVHLGTVVDGEDAGETVRLPIQATFLRAVDQAGLSKGDTFLIKRFDDQLKKKGKGAGKPMAIYGIKVTERAANFAS